MVVVKDNAHSAIKTDNIEAKNISMAKVVDDFTQSYQCAKAVDEDVVIVILKSDNANIVVYSTKPESGTLQTGAKPVRKHWQTWEELKEGDAQPPTHELSAIEKRLVYGVKYSSTSESEIRFTLTGCPKLPITFELTGDGRVEASLVFSEITHRFRGIYVHMPSSSTNVSSKIRPGGISLMVQLPMENLAGGEPQLSPVFPIYIASGTELQ
jgi:hypothetical protein